MSEYSLRQLVGACFLDVPGYFFYLFLALFFPEKKYWVRICNRHEIVSRPTSESEQGVLCDWQWTSDLYLPKIFPVFGRLLYRRALDDFSIVMQDRPVEQSAGKPEISCIIGHRGLERLPHLLATLQSIAAQKECRVECIVVEQDNERLIEKHLPPWVLYIHTPLPEKDMAYSRSRAFNAGVRAAQGEFLIFHDNDMLVPSVYARELHSFFCKGFEVVNLKRFIFYLDQMSSEKICRESTFQFSPEINAIMQNAEGGGSIGISRTAFFEIGGFDERFIGWGGEDNEFWERAQTRKVYPYGYLPLVHLWHPPSEGKAGRSAGNALYMSLSKQPVAKRISRLQKIRSGTFDDSAGS